MSNFVTPSPRMKVKIKRRKLNAHVTITAPDGLELRTTLDRNIKRTDDKIEILKRRMVHQSTARK